jgi:3-hydroxymyristoyl/3-hydroxydecanoyl-(acyl carrier protein) dehydratase
MLADGRPIVEISDISLQLFGNDRESLRALWAARVPPPPPAVVQGFDRERILAFAVGKPSEAFGEPYRVFDRDRVIARLPGPPYQFLDRITAIDAQPWKLVAGGTIVAEYDVPADAWYFAADRQPTMPFAVLLEVALQPCGWLAAYLGSALTSPQDLCFRNLGGTAIFHQPVGPHSGTLASTIKITRLSTSGGMIIQNFDFSVRVGDTLIYQGDTYFGFFSHAALAQQVGVREARPYVPSEDERQRGRSFPVPDVAPMPARLMRMVEQVDLFVADGGPHGLGFIQGSKRVNPDEWFFKAHFYQDPVWPGSLGLESFLQLMKVAALERWGLAEYHWHCPALGQPHRWLYRGQVLPTHGLVTVQASITAVDDATRTLRADGFLSVDGRVIYQMNDFSLTTG